jgi:hypothetical protein
MDRSKLASAPSRPAVFPQERPKVFPGFAFAPGVFQSTSPAASGLEVCSRARIYDHPDAVAAFLVPETKQFGNAPSPRFCLFCSPQLNIELEHGSEIVVEHEPVPSRKTFPFQFPQVVNCLSKLPV